MKVSINQITKQLKELVKQGYEIQGFSLEFDHRKIPDFDEINMVYNTKDYGTVDVVIRAKKGEE